MACDRIQLTFGFQGPVATTSQLTEGCGKVGGFNLPDSHEYELMAGSIQFAVEWIYSEDKSILNDM